MLTHKWLPDGSLQLTTVYPKTVASESIDDWYRMVLRPEDLGPLRHLLALGPRISSGEVREDLVAGKPDDNKVAGKHEKGSGA